MGRIGDFEFFNNRMARAEMAKTDIIGAIMNSEEISELRYFEFEVDGKRVSELDKEIDDLLDEHVTDQEHNKKLSDMIVEIRTMEENRGFREGFSVATRILMQALSGRATL